MAAGAQPMGSEVVAAGGAVRLFVAAMKADVPLASIDVVKLSSDAAGKTSLSVKTLPLAAGGQSTACVSWKEPAQDPKQPALYYARVFQQPTFRWSHDDCVAAGAGAPAGCAPGGGLDVQVQERAWTSPIRVRP